MSAHLTGNVAALECSNLISAAVRWCYYLISVAYLQATQRAAACLVSWLCSHTVLYYVLSCSLLVSCFNRVLPHIHIHYELVLESRYHSFVLFVFLTVSPALECRVTAQSKEDKIISMYVLNT